MHRLDSQGHVRHRDFVWKVMEAVVKGNTTGMLLTKYSKVQSLKLNISANIFPDALLSRTFRCVMVVDSIAVCAETSITSGETFEFSRCTQSWQCWYFCRPQRSCGKVMFLHLSVILFMEGRGCLPQCMLGYIPTGQTLGVSAWGVSTSVHAGIHPRQTPPGRHTPRQTPLLADTPWADTSCKDTPPVQTSP